MTDRPVTLSDPAHFYTAPRGPDYGCVFWSDGALGQTVYSFDREGIRFCCLINGGPREGVLIVQGRSFRIAGPVSGRAAA